VSRERGPGRPKPEGVSRPRLEAEVRGHRVPQLLQRPDVLPGPPQLTGLAVGDRPVVERLGEAWLQAQRLREVVVARSKSPCSTRRLPPVFQALA
jgi:hypothetical protein